MDSELQNQMLKYYNERANEYEQIYTQGTGTSSITNPEVFKSETIDIKNSVKNFGRGSIIDIACGTGYWLPYYYSRCNFFTFFDQSKNMLAKCKIKTNELNLYDKCNFILGDLAEFDFSGMKFESAIAGFLISHLTEELENKLFETLRIILKANSYFLLIDSAWTEYRSKFNTKVERQKRKLNDGTEFYIYKKYLDENDIRLWRSKYNVELSIDFFGHAFFVVRGRFKNDSNST